MRKLLVFAAMAALAVGVAACTGDDDDDVATSPTATPSPSPSGTPVHYNFTINSDNTWPHTTGGVRVVHGTSRIFCRVGTQFGPATTAWTVSTSGLFTAVSGTAYTVEIYGDIATANQYNTGDHTWTFTRPATAASNYVLTFSHTTAVQSAITWPNGTGCP